MSEASKIGSFFAEVLSPTDADKRVLGYFKLLEKGLDTINSIEFPIKIVMLEKEDDRFSKFLEHFLRFHQIETTHHEKAISFILAVIKWTPTAKQDYELIGMMALSMEQIPNSEDKFEILHSPEILAHLIRTKA